MLYDIDPILQKEKAAGTNTHTTTKSAEGAGKQAHSSTDNIIIQQGISESQGKKFSTRNTRYLELAKEPEKNRAEMQNMVDEAAEAGENFGKAGESESNLSEKRFSTKNIVDSEGNSLSEQQAEYFKDSKIRDENGNLLVVYHGTDAKFTVFDVSMGRPDMDIQGMFFSPDKNDALGYGSNAKAYYLNIKNPADISTGFAALKKYRGQNNAGIKAREYLESLGYDGVDNEDEYIAFYPEQAKLVSNKAPTENPDLRYSLRNGAKEEIHKAITDVKYRNEIVISDGTPSIITSQKGAKNLPLSVKPSHVRENVYTEKEAMKLSLPTGTDHHYHGLGEPLYVSVLEELDEITEAYRGTKNADDPSRRENYFILISKQKDDTGNTINVPVFINEVGVFRVY